MKSDLLKISIFILGIVVMGCDPVFDVDYEVSNASGKSIFIVIDHSGISKDTNSISDGTRLIILNASSICCTTKEYLDRLKTIPFEISIVNSSGLNYKKDASDISNWSKLYPDKSDGLGRVQLTVGPDDF